MLRQVSHDLSDDTAELVAVTGEPRGDRHLRVRGMPVEDEMAVRAVGEETGLEHYGRPLALGEVAPGERPEQLLVVRPGLEIRRLGVHDLAQVVVLAELEAGDKKAG